MADTKEETKKSVEKAAPKKVSKLSLTFVDMLGKEAGTVSLPEEIFDVTASDALLAQYVRVYRSNQRQGTPGVKTRAEVVGSTRKIYRQKGTGRARHGAKSAPIFVGGGVTHGPTKREFNLKINKKQRIKALYYALSKMLKNASIVGLDLTKHASKTKESVAAIAALKIENKNRVLIVCSSKENASGVKKSFTNIENVDCVMATILNAFDVIKSRNIVFTKSGLEEFIEFRGFKS